MSPRCFAYYCSGHGYGHATRVSAFASYLLSLPETIRPIVHITSSAPKMVFSEAIACGAHYRESLIDPVIVQPVAYQVDRRRSVDVLEDFLDKKDSLLTKEVQWLKTIKADCVLSDAAFLGCLAANALQLPSVLITNFSFDSIYSFLATPIPDSRPEPHPFHLQSPPFTKTMEEDIPDIPITEAELSPLVKQIWSGYRCADLLLLLPAHIPIPSFQSEPQLPASGWIDPVTSRPFPELSKYFGSPWQDQELLSSIPFYKDQTCHANGEERVSFPGDRKRQVIPTPLIVRSPSSDPSPYSFEGRSKLLTEIGVPLELQDPVRTKVLIVSFGGQVFKRPARSGSRTPNSKEHSPERISFHRRNRSSQGTISLHVNGSGSPDAPPDTPSTASSTSSLSTLVETVHTSLPRPHSILSPQPLATVNQIFIPGAPPAVRPDRSMSPTLSPRNRFASFPSTPALQEVPSFVTIPPTPSILEVPSYDMLSPANPSSEYGEDIVDLLPDENWIAIVCGVSKSQWLAQQAESGSSAEEGLPERFFVAPRDVYMPDLTAVGDVLLGKLGYGTVSEAVDACTPFVYVSRPLFIEEHGLRQYLTLEGTGVELSRECYELGDWAWAIQEAYEHGKAKKANKRDEMTRGVRGDLKEKGVALAKDVVEWADDWHRRYGREGQ